MENSSQLFELLCDLSNYLTNERDNFLLERIVKYISNESWNNCEQKKSDMTRIRVGKKFEDHVSKFMSNKSNWCMNMSNILVHIKSNLIEIVEQKKQLFNKEIDGIYMNEYGECILVEAKTSINENLLPSIQKLCKFCQIIVQVFDLWVQKLETSTSHEKKKMKIENWITFSTGKNSKLSFEDIEMIVNSIRDNKFKIVLVTRKNIEMSFFIYGLLEHIRRGMYVIPEDHNEKYDFVTSLPEVTKYINNLDSKISSFRQFLEVLNDCFDGYNPFDTIIRLDHDC